MPPPPPQIGKEWEEGTGESSSPPRPSSAHHDLRHRIIEGLLEVGKQGESDPSSFREKLYTHFEKLPDRYLIDLGVDKAEEVLLHREILEEVASNGKPVFRARFVKYAPAQPNSEGTYPDCDDPTQRLLLEDLTLERIHSSDNTRSMSSPSRDSEPSLVHEIIFSSLDKPKLLMRIMPTFPRIFSIPRFI